MLPAWVYPWRMGGPNEADATHWGHQWYGHPDYGWTFNVYSHLLINYGYVTNDQRADTTGLSGTAIYREMAKVAERSIFACPAGWAPPSSSQDYISEVEGKEEEILMTPRNNYDENRSFTGHRLLHGYYVNMDAGSFRWYHHSYGSKAVKWGFFPRINWRSEPSEVMHIIETNNFLVDHNHMRTMYDANVNAWSLGGDRYGPAIRHRSRTKNNIAWGDGHVSNWDSPLTGKPFPWRWY